ncbi:uncharacterized protein LOC131236692 [Magnolia sinica]|uniref:uncharacterized protein LOC131236692 n=1 Tax=Magnolia sinica TaxID=86752 RepID=UPI002657C014|nr:uncharacterized protein LOC131236692 [Magnolia sinica]
MARRLHSKMSQTRGRSSGWAAFDLKQQQKQGVKPEHDIDPYPPMPNITSAHTTGNLVMNNFPPKRSFASVVQPSVAFPVLINNTRSGIQAATSSKKLENQAAEGSSITANLEKLKKLHSWADDSLIEDVLAAVSDDGDQASAILRAMVPSGSEELKTNLRGKGSILEDYLIDHNIEQGGEVVSLEDQLSNNTQVELIPGHLFSVPIETEWQEDDVYLSHRKDAIRMMRSASQHSRAANNAFLRGDRFSAQQLSQKARDEWLAAEKLNARAAEEILRIRNGNNDDWKLDLHGLHASEAVRALEEHLQRIETQMPMRRSASCDGLAKPEAGMVHIHFESPSCLDMEGRAGKQLALSRPRQTILQVITGTGNHSRGQAALPMAVRSFLIENGYRFDDARPGVFAVRPKFRHR